MPRLLLGLLLGAAAILASAAASAQTFPSKAIKLIVPFPAGGPNDIIARAVGQRMSEILKQPVLIDNRGGAGGVVGTDAVAKAAPDGYTIAITSAGALALSPSVVAKLPYSTLRDLKPITLVAKVPEMLVVATSVPAKNLAELIALAKSQPGKLNFASTGPGSMPHLSGELFRLAAKIDVVHVPYRGAAPVVNDLLGQQVQMVFLDLPVLLPQVKAGKIRAIAIGAKTRSQTAPDVPTTGEGGYPQIEAENWYGMVAPAATPQPVVDILHKAAVEALHDAGVQAKLGKLGLTLIGNSPAEFAAYVKRETEKWGNVVKEAGIKPQ
jgi:tripartite-type tricarboxylate transporter receptor subunit TctC